MTDLLLSAIDAEPVRSASRDADSLAALSILGEEGALRDPDAVTFSAHAVEVAALRLALAGDTSPRNTLNTTRSFSSGLLFDVLAIAHLLYQAQTRTCATNDDTGHSNNQAVELGLEWLPNDRVVGLAKLERTTQRGSSRVVAETTLASAPSLQTEQVVALAEGRPLGLPYSSLKAPTALATAAAQALSQRGLSVTLVGQPGYSWSAAERLAATGGSEVRDDLVESIGAGVTLV
ncbi:MAG: hypothetical protein OXG52_10830 [bacterium]|nr:hypothetical protein [bacterium]